MKSLRIPQLVAALLSVLSLVARAALPTVPAVTAEPVRSFGAAGLLQAGFGLAMVIALIFLCAWLARRFGLPRYGNDRLLKVVSSAMVGQRERVVVIEIGDSWLVLGVAAGRVNALHTMPAEKIPDITASAQQATQGVNAFSQKLLESLSKLNRARKPD